MTSPRPRTKWTVLQYGHPHDLTQLWRQFGIPDDIHIIWADDPPLVVMELWYGSSRHHALRLDKLLEQLNAL